VRRGFRAGAYRKKGGKFIIFPPGTTYQCNENDYHDPEHVPDNGHHVVCGPYTYLTVRDGTYNGAWRKDTGTFEEFTEAGKLYELHTKDYRDVVSVPIISDEPQTFGPYTCIRITDGHSGIVRKAGKLEVLPSGPHKLGPEYEILESVPLQTFTHEISNLKFNAKDSPVMAVFATISYKVNDAKQVAIRDGGFDAVKQALKYQSELILQTKCSTFNRDELLPTKSDIMVDQKSGEHSEDKADYDDAERLKEIYEENEREKHERYEDIANTLSEKLTLSAANGAWGVDIMNVTLRGFYLLDDKIKANLEKITRDVMDTKAQRVQAALEIEKAKTDKEKRVKQAEADAFVAQKEAEASAKVAKQKALANAEVAKQEALAHAEVKRTTAKADAEARIETATADNKAKVIIEKAKAEADAESRKIKLDIANKEKEETARANAKAIELMANANFLKSQKEHEAAGLVPAHEVRLRELEQYVKAVEHNAGAAWINPHPLGASLKRVEEFVGMSVPQMLNPNVHTRVVVEGREAKDEEEMETAPLLPSSSTRKVKKHST
jgi:regulator of protease activity HflC (stomatin/prohibitin superfamily)